MGKLETRSVAIISLQVGSVMLCKSPQASQTECAPVRPGRELAHLIQRMTAFWAVTRALREGPRFARCHHSGPARRRLRPTALGKQALITGIASGTVQPSQQLTTVDVHTGEPCRDLYTPRRPIQIELRSRRRLLRGSHTRLQINCAGRTLLRPLDRGGRRCGARPAQHEEREPWALTTASARPRQRATTCRTGSDVRKSAEAARSTAQKSGSVPRRADQPIPVRLSAHEGFKPLVEERVVMNSRGCDWLCGW
ncbi:hypothetical protein BKA18_003485 [Streptomyces auratus]